uniref:Uncharacterized protein n=1 Tax=Anguilla anguilla TaxID=7936 RepID=A0A0E9R6Y7_ANGAN
MSRSVLYPEVLLLLSALL